MNILMMSNTYTPLAGGLERSIKSFATAYRKRGHRVLLVAPAFDRMPRREQGVLRVAAIPRIGGSAFSARLPIPGLLEHVSEVFQPDVVHAHHPFLMGDTALRIASLRQVPLVFTHHVLFEQYTRCLLPLRTNVAQRFVIDLATGFSNLCDQIFAPSQSVAELLHKRGVTAPVDVVPTGVDLARFRGGNRAQLRKAANLPADAFVVGHLGRLALEKNLRFLATAVASFLREEPRGWFIIGGQGPGEAMIRQVCRDAGVDGRLRVLGELKGHWLADAYHLMDVFVFASQSETQGLVLVEAMSAGVPVVAVDAPGVRDVVIDGHNGRLLPTENSRQFAAALHGISALTVGQRDAMLRNVYATAKQLSMTLCAERALKFYSVLIARSHKRRIKDVRYWARVKRSLHTEMLILKKTVHATQVLIEEACAHA
ncbi:MAG: glycosyl transferase family 1 [Candidatus Omnitrophica bacterium CG11_big_fil_rev_8_21_14_0_20_63_9]|nr:MAG: glycosyl transferase family 1 [Candidatus Omnitrophica bacterium CG11_big_fil_rev_8_21_14_0_20_63_9]